MTTTRKRIMKSAPVLVAACGLAAVLVAYAAMPAGGDDGDKPGVDADEPTVIWREGETADARDVTDHPWYGGQIDTDRLSGGAFVSHWDKDKAGWATYRVQVAEAGRYTLWVRASPVGAALSVQVDGGEWSAIDTGEREAMVNTASDGKADLRFLAWLNAGRHTLNAGQHTFRFRFHSDNHHHGAVDAFLLTTGDRLPDDAERPAPASAAESFPPGDETTWVFNPEPDPLRDDAVLDLRHLNEKRAGETGFIRTSEDSMGFVRGDGQPIRFWAVTSFGWRLPPAEMDRHCRFLAKMGVNLVRVHAQVPALKGGAIDDVDNKEVLQILRFVKACRDNGIYLIISPFYPNNKVPANWQLEGVEEGSSAFGLIFTSPKLRAAYKAWVENLYTRPNPYTGEGGRPGPAIKDEPAVAVLQVLNEDTTLFYTFQYLPERQRQKIEKAFGDWLIEKYGSLDKAKAAWGGAGHKADAFADGRAGLHIIWHQTQDDVGNLKTRLRDELRFRAEFQRAFYAEMAAHLRSLGCRQLINATNWKSADKVKLDDIERWTYTPTEVMAVNRYAAPPHRGPNSGWRIEPGHHVAHRSLLHEPLRLPTNLKQPVGYPFLVTETAWVNPNRYQAEGPLLGAAYMSLNGVDGLCWFAWGAETWKYDPKFPWQKVAGQHPQHKWHFAYPHTAGMFPANALMYRRGDLKAGDPVVVEHRSREAMWRRDTPVIAETETYDPNRDAKDLGARAGEAAFDVSRLAFLVGPVHVVFDSEESKTRVADLSPFIDGQNATVRSNTGELSLDYGQGVFTVDSPRTQAVAGFLKAAGGRFDLGTVTVRSDDDYAVVQVTSMDDQPIATSGKLLVQIGTRARQQGWTTVAASFKDGDQQVQGERVVNVGRPPWRVVKSHVTLTIDNPALRSATRLDGNGYPAGDVAVNPTDGGVTLDVPADTLWVVIE